MQCNPITLLCKVVYTKNMKISDGDHEGICPVAKVAELVGDECTLLVVRDLLDGKMRFGELEQSLSPISSRTITNKLKMLQEKGIVTRTAYKETPPRVTYELTEEGKKLGAIIREMRKFGKNLL